LDAVIDYHNRTVFASLSHGDERKGRWVRLLVILVTAT
jgi:hypothetical protein